MIEWLPKEGDGRWNDKRLTGLAFSSKGSFFNSEPKLHDTV